jgi:hypothetical protein
VLPDPSLFTPECCTSTLRVPSTKRRKMLAGNGGSWYTAGKHNCLAHVPTIGLTTRKQKIWLPSCEQVVFMAHSERACTLWCVGQAPCALSCKAAPRGQPYAWAQNECCPQGHLGTILPHDSPLAMRLATVVQRTSVWFYLS